MKVNKLEFLLMNNPFRALSQKYYEFPQMIKDYDNTHSFDNVLEIGCGNGYGAKLIKSKFDVKNYFGIDLDEKMIEIALKKKLEGCKFEVGSVTKLPYEDNSFEAIFDFGILHHVPDWRNAINEIARTLKPGGYFIFEDFTKDSFNSITGKVIKIFFDHPYKYIYSSKEISEYLKDVGLDEISIKISHPLLVELIFGAYKKVVSN